VLEPLVEHVAVFPNDYKLSILAEYDRCSEPGEKGALLRREGLYSSLITDWRRQHREGSARGDRGPRLRRRPRVPVSVRSRPLRAENER
jgi:transposase